MNAPRLQDAAHSSEKPGPRPPVGHRPPPAPDWDWLKKGLGLLALVHGGPLAAFGAMGVAVGVVQVVAPDEGKRAADGAGIVLMALVFFLVGRFLWKKGMSPFRNARLREQLRGFVHAQPRIRVSDVAAQLALPEAKVEALLNTLIARHEVDLVYLSGARAYIHRDAWERGRNVARRCPSCDAPVVAEAAMPGDKVVCDYCSAAFLVA